jgi:hypothetical protein
VRIEKSQCALLSTNEFARFQLLPSKPAVTPWVVLCSFERPIPSLRPLRVTSKRIQRKSDPSASAYKKPLNSSGKSKTTFENKIESMIRKID